jgi:phosphohistidine phosphatase
MKLYLMRHAEAEDGEQLDPTRELTDTGKAQAKLMGKWLHRQADPPELIIESNMRRSIQTAKRVGKRLDVNRLRAGALDPDGEPRKAIRTIRRLAQEHSAASVLAVTHSPLVQAIQQHLTGVDPEKMYWKHGAISYFDDDGMFHWMVTPETAARDEDEAEKITVDALEVAEASLAIAVASI